ncbi:MAG: hydrogenase expression/formation protein HypE [Chlamydiota bacterium]|nr:hydrogenase expression/formation protein HypE [Chlamydiota bacterium]
MNTLANEFTQHCPVPISDYANILMAHGSGGKLTHQLIDTIFLPQLSNPYLNQRHDGAVLDLMSFSQHTRMAMTTDSYVIKPLFFPGGDIGSLGVYGTVNDLAMCGARPLFMSLALILEEGLAMETLQRVICSIKKASEETSVQCVTGDTKVVDKGKGDGLYLNTTGIGVVEHDLLISPLSVSKGDHIIVSGDIGRHGMAVMALREGLEFESRIVSDAASVVGVVLDLIQAGIRIHCLRDLTRGGLGNALVEIARTRHSVIHVDECAIPVTDDVKNACEVLGLDPLYVANEGRFIMILPEEDADRALQIMRRHKVAECSALIGEVLEVDADSHVSIKSIIGTSRIVDMLSAEQMPRIC